MLLYLSIFLIPLIWYELSKAHPEKGSSKGILFVVFLFIALFIGLGDMQGGYDRYIYGAYFDDLADSIRVDLPWRSYGSEYGYSLFNWLIAHITQNRYIYTYRYLDDVCMLLSCFRYLSRRLPVSDYRLHGLALLFYNDLYASDTCCGVCLASLQVCL